MSHESYRLARSEDASERVGDRHPTKAPYQKIANCGKEHTGYQCESIPHELTFPPMPTLPASAEHLFRRPHAEPLKEFINYSPSTALKLLRELFSKGETLE